jgi:hypothetical protein
MHRTEPDQLRQFKNSAAGRRDTFAAKANYGAAKRPPAQDGENLQSTIVYRI